MIQLAIEIPYWGQSLLRVLGGLVAVLRWLARVLTPWSSHHEAGVGIPYLDYARGDGRVIGAGGEPWDAVVIDDSTPWVGGYRGLWGLDTGDRLGGERGPAGPRYERDGTVRPSWADPVGWAGLAKVAPNPAVEREYVQARVAQIDGRLEELEVYSLAKQVGRFVQLFSATPPAPSSPCGRPCARRTSTAGARRNPTRPHPAPSAAPATRAV